MALVVFPSTLPGPSVSAVTPAERRLSSDVSGGPQQFRGVQRDYLGMQSIEWDSLDATQAAALDTWFNATLTSGGAWFASTWPAPQGWVSLVRRFIGAPVWSHRPGGFWHVSARVQVRGRGLAPTDCLTDTFVGGIGQYALLSGSLAPFSNPSSPTALRTTATAAADNVSRIARPVSTRLLSEATVRFRLRSIGNDDACLIALYQGASLKIALNPMREAFYDGSKAPHVYIGVTDYPVGAGALSVGVTYEMTLTMPPVGNTVCVVTNLDTGAIVQTTSLGMQAQPIIDSLVFYVDEASPGKLCETDFFYLHIC